jgi:hypothetical protein
MLALFALCAYGTVNINHGRMEGRTVRGDYHRPPLCSDGVASLAYSVYYSQVTNLEEN